MPTLYVVATPIGNLSDMSPRAVETLSAVQLIAAEDTSHTIKLLNHFEIKTPMISYHKYNEAERSSTIIERMLNDNIDVAIVTDAGTPCVSDPGYDLIRAARESGITVIGIPGCCAAVTALSISGFPSDTFAFIGFLEREKKEQHEQLKKMNELDIDSLIVYESPFRLLSTLQNIRDVIDCNICVCNDITKLHEFSISGDINEVLPVLEEKSNIEKGEYVIIINKHKTETVDEAEPADKLSLEAMIVDIMVKEGKTAKDAVAAVRKSCPDISKKEIYAASLKLKELFGE